MLQDILKEFYEKFETAGQWSKRTNETPLSIISDDTICASKESIIDFITHTYNTVRKEVEEDKAKYINDGYQSCLREVKARVGSLEEKKFSNDVRDVNMNCNTIGYNNCLDEVKKLINEI